MTGLPPFPGTPIPAALLLRALQASRLLTDDQLARLQLADNDPLADGAALARRFLELGLLTRFQTERLLAGRPEGLVIGHYRILDQLGAGGMGHVFLAEHDLLRRRVALKVLAEHLVVDAAAIARFRWEVQVAAQLSHPNIVAVYDAGEADGRHYLVMEYVDGVDLGCLVRERGPLPVPLACECIRQAAMGLQHAFHAGFLHCDIKPANFLLTRNNEPGLAREWTVASPLFTSHDEFRMVKIVDLGLARQLEPSGTNGTGHKKPTAGEDLAGSVDYLAPEQAHDPRQADIRSDLYALGCTFYFLLTSRAPFPGGAWPDKLLRHQLDQAIPIRTLRPEVPAAIEAVVTRLMSKSPAERYALPAEVAVVLHEWLAQHRNGNGEVAPAVRRPAATTPRTPVSFDTDTLPLPPVLPLPATELATVRIAPTYPAVRPQGRTRWLVLGGAAVVLGLLSAAIVHFLPGETSWEKPTAVAPAAPQPAHRITLSSRPNTAFATLAAALAAAQDGDTLLLQGGEPHVTGPLSLHGKALTLRAVGAARPRLQLALTAASWQPLLTTDRALTLHGLDLSIAEPARKSRPVSGTPHLIYAVGTPVQLTSCRLVCPNHSGLIVARQAVALVLDDCEVTARTAPVFVEVGTRPATIHVTGCRVSTTEERGAALALWASEASEPDGLTLDLTSSTIQAGRVAAFSGLPRAVTITAQNNRLTFREALLSYAGGTRADAWRQVTRWQGRDNRYHGVADWVMVEGGATGVRGLEQWRGLWRDAEAGSTEEIGPVAERGP